MAVPPLECPDRNYLLAAAGWLELGNPVEALAELDRIRPEHRGHPDALEMLWHIHAKWGKWADCAQIAGVLIELDPGRSDGWVHRSFALHELKRTREAYEALLPAERRFPRVWTIPYNLACYSAQLGRIEEARRWLEKAVALGGAGAENAAKDDPDLDPLRGDP